MTAFIINKEQLIDNYHRFCRWQQAVPHYVNRHEGEVQHCHNCGKEFDGNFCPICGQRAEVGRVGWNSIKENIAVLWGLDSRSLTYTLVQLLGRPGYLVRDYISGHRQVSFPPVKMLVIVCLFMVIFESLFHLENDVLSLNFKIKEADEVVAWMNAQKSWTTLLVQSILILPTWLVFRYAPAYPRHTLPEGFFLQVFISSQTLILGFSGYWSGTAEFVLCLIFMYITYRQLFGYGWWSTLWRLAVVVLSEWSFIFVVLAIVLAFFEFIEVGKNEAVTMEGFLLFIGGLTAIVTVALCVTHFINKRTNKTIQ
jgi:hypothetical protein